MIYRTYEKEKETT